MIPQFSPSGVLPPATGDRPYRASLREVEQTLVDDFGGLPWRRVEFDGLHLLSVSVDEIAVGARWWIWGSLVSNREAPLFGDRHVLSAALLVPAESVVDRRGKVAMLTSTARSAEELHRVDVQGVIYVFPPDHISRHVTDSALTKFRARASRSIVDDVTMNQIHAGFIEVTS